MNPETTPARPGATWWIPERLEPALVAMGVGDCQGCELHRGPGTTPPAGDGPSANLVGPGPVPARVVVVAAQPAGDVGTRGDGAGQGAGDGAGEGADPVGRLVHTCLERAGVDPATTWTTYAVKHAGPGRELDPAHVTACAPWWHAELEMVRPCGVVLLGDAVAQALVGDHAAELVRGRTAPWPREMDRPVRQLDAEHHPTWVLLTRDPRDAVDEHGQPVAAEVDALVAELGAAAPAGPAGAGSAVEGRGAQA